MQVACPRLSIDWGMAFEKPLLSPYEVSEISIPIPERSYVEQLCFKNYLSCIYFCKHVLIYVHTDTHTNHVYLFTDVSLKSSFYKSYKIQLEN